MGRRIAAKPANLYADDLVTGQSCTRHTSQRGDLGLPMLLQEAVQADASPSTGTEIPGPMFEPVDRLQLIAGYGAVPEIRCIPDALEVDGADRVGGGSGSAGPFVTPRSRVCGHECPV